MKEPPATPDRDSLIPPPGDEAYFPELGQALWTNSPWLAVVAPDRVHFGISVLADVIAEQRGDEGPLTSNYGQEDYEGSVFTLRTYCWCDGHLSGHEDGCPPNFEHHASGITVAWYKWAGRGTSMSRSTDAAEWARIVQECLTSLVGASTPGEAASGRG